jgi:hypothetical protein
LDATVGVDLCHRSGLEYLSHGFQTQGTIAARAGLKVRPKSLVYLGRGFQTQGTGATVVDLKVRPESTCVPGPWISDPRYEARVLRVLGPMVQSVKTTCS